MRRYHDLIIWHTGWLNLNLFPAAERETLMDYLDQGRGLILASQDFLSHVPPGPFTADYLGIADWTTDLAAGTVTGVGGDPITNGMSFELDYPYPDLNRPDDVEPNALGTVIFRSELDYRIGVRADNGTSRAVVFSYFFNAMDESLPDPNNPATLLDRSIRWLIEDLMADVPDEGATDRGASSPIRLESSPRA